MHATCLLRHMACVVCCTLFNPLELLRATHSASTRPKVSFCIHLCGSASHPRPISPAHLRAMAFAARSAVLSGLRAPTTARAQRQQQPRRALVVRASEEQPTPSTAATEPEVGSPRL